MNNIDKRNRFANEVFSYRTSKDNKIFIFWQGKQIMILKGRRAEKFLAKITGLEHREAQLMMAKVTGNFKHGNEH